ncbi:MAG: hypothetical protein K9L66_00115 [Spirochaetaceae bacterium]|nr:hypothetical protein [Spirochaetaceae bacterium]MCF7947149.1 hypothetical protein [Spirochaetia bacterium]MCF7950014.1 hypothetical protein [Spirochaetaceae bacterium]
MRRIVLLLLGVCFLGGTAGLVFGQSEETEEENWKKRIASPSYGLTMGFFELKYGPDRDQSETLLMPGIDIRHFNGLNVPRSGGFYYGYEIGLLANFYLGGDQFPFDDGVETVPGTVESMMAASGFLMLKHGYRFSLGTGDYSPVFGFEIGAGIAAGGADLIINNDENEDESNLVDDLADEPVGPIFELGIEGGLPLGKNLRFVTRLGITVLPVPSLDSEKYGEMSPPRIGLRGGLTWNH